jgi:hypothetical protein
MIKSELGKIAGKVWQYLGKNGKSEITILPSKLKLESNDLIMALGWLAREDKLLFSQESKKNYVALTPTELCVYKHAQNFPPCCGY